MAKLQEDTLMISPITPKGSKKLRTRRSSSSSGTSTYTPLRGIATSTPLSFEKACENAVIENRLNTLPEVVDDESSND